MRKAMFIASNGIYIDGYTDSLILIPDEIPSNAYVIDNPDQDLLENYMHYKIVDGVPMKMADEEYNTLYPPQPSEPTAEETQNDFNLDIDYRVACLEIGIV